MTLLEKLFSEDSELPTLTAKEAIIMQLISANGAMYGLEMVAQSGKLKRGTVYVTLNRLEDKGYIESKLKEPEAGEHGPARRVYSLTGHGARTLAAWESFAGELERIRLEGAR